MKKDKCGIYQILCVSSGRFYIGSSVRIQARWYAHRSDLRRGKSTCIFLQNAWSKYGEDDFEFSVLEECSKEELEAKEQFYIDTLKPNLNIITDVKRRYSAQSRAKIVASARARAALRTHCPHGHEYSDANTYRNAKGDRLCRACNTLRVSKIYARETSEEREKRLQRAKVNYWDNREMRLAQSKIYAASRKEHLAAYNRAYRKRPALVGG